MTSLALATGLDFINFMGSTPTPGTAGVITVNSASGDFLSLAGTVGTMKDFTFAGSGSLAFPSTSIAGFQQIGGLSFDLLSVAVLLQMQNFLLLTGTGTFHLSGFEATAGTFDFSGNGTRQTFSFSASQGTIAQVPESASLLVFAVGLLGAGGYARRRMTVAGRAS